MDLQPEGTGNFLHAQRGLGACGISRVDQHSNTHGLRHQFMQECQPLGHQLPLEIIDAGRIAGRSGEAGDKTKLDRVFTDAEHNESLTAEMARAKTAAHSHTSRNPSWARKESPDQNAGRDRSGHAVLGALTVGKTPRSAQAGCCARAASGHAAALPSPAINSRRRINCRPDAKLNALMLVPVFVLENPRP
jgi:hypothetical protein